MSHKSFTQLIKWSHDQYSHLPWRKNRTLYKTLVSEIMLQQTTVGTVLNHFEKFLDEYPDIFSLAKSSEEQVCISWKGLGYYRRARNLRNLAIQIVEQFKGKIPTEVDKLQSLKGVGPYTSNAIVAIGADQKGLAVDANLERVLSRFYGIEQAKGPKLQQDILSDFKNGKILVEMNKISPRDLNESLMDLGRVLCQARRASCLICPLKDNCKAHQLRTPLAFPIGNLNEKKTDDLFITLLRVVVKNKNQILFYQKSEKEWLAGQWELPTFIVDTNDEKLKQYPKIAMRKKFESTPIFKTGITKYSIQNHVLEMSLTDFKKLTKNIDTIYKFKSNNDRLNLSTASIKALKKMNSII